MTKKEERQLSAEATSVLFWFLADGFLLMEWKWLMCISFIISMFYGGLVFCYLEKSLIPVLVAITDTLWLAMGIFWAGSEVFELSWGILTAKICFWMGVSFCVFAYLKSGANPGAALIVLRRLRVIRVLGTTSSKS